MFHNISDFVMMCCVSLNEVLKFREAAFSRSMLAVISLQQIAKDI